MKQYLKFLSFFLVLFASGTLHAQTDTNLSMVIKVRKPQNSSSTPEGYKFSDYFSMFYAGEQGGCGFSGDSQRRKVASLLVTVNYLSLPYLFPHPCIIRLL